MLPSLAYFAAALCLGGAATAVPSDCDSPGFIAPRLYDANLYAGGLAVARIDSDSRADVVLVSNNADQTLAVYVTNADGTLAPPIYAASPNGGQALAIGDFDHDDKADAVVSDPFGPLWLYLGNGDGTFQSPVNLGDAGSANVVIAADVDGDGEMDIVAGTNPWITVYLGHGDGTFDGPLRTPVFSADPLALGDVNGDGHLDAISLRSTDGSTLNRIVYYPGRGDGTFDPAVEAATGADFHSVGVGDFNGDGKSDLYVTMAFSVVIYPGNGDGTFGPGITTFAPPTPWRAYPADLNGDGKLDLLVTQIDQYNSSLTGALEVLLGVGDGTFTYDTGYFAGNDPYLVAVSDLQNDGNQDVIVFSGQAPSLRVLNGIGGGRLAAHELIQYNVGVRKVVSGDFNEDGFPDFVALGDLDSIAETYLFPTFGHLGGRFTGSSMPGGGRLSGLGTADFDGDGHLDLATLRGDDSTLRVFTGHGDGTFTPGSTIAAPTVGFFSVVLLADLDGNGKPDVITLDLDPSAMTPSVGVFVGVGDGTFSPRPTLDLSFTPGGIAVGDLNGDSRDDVVITGYDQILVFIGNGDGTFAAPIVRTGGTFQGGVAIGDLDDDGHADLAVEREDDTKIDIYRGMGDGTFEDPYSVQSDAIGSPGTGIVAIDLDGDGHLDLVSDSLVVLKGIGDGSFDSPVTYALNVWPSGPAFADFDGNSTTDMVVGSGTFYGGGSILLRSAKLAARIPDAVSAVTASRVSIAAGASGLGVLTYQWRKGGIPLNDGGSISGSQTATLSIDPASFADAGFYDVLVTDSCNDVASNAATLSVEFADVAASSPFHDDIIAIATAGITTGCGGGNYCPTSSVRRDQMAVFLLKSEHGSGYTPPTCAGIFADVPCPSPFADWVEQLAAEGVTSGCGGGNYCPSSAVTRAQMAVFLLKTSQGSSYTPPPATGIFGDVPVGSFAADFIEDLYNRGITGGCQASPLLYCPGNAVLRQQMATFLVRTF